MGELSLLFDAAQRPSAAQIRAQLAALAGDYTGRAIELHETGAGFRIQVRGQYAGSVARLWPERPQRYSRALLETLALIAYRQPITRAEIEAVRGVAVNPNITRTLLERQWIRIVGHRDLPGSPELLGTTREFLEYFGLKSLDQLPPLAQLRSLGELDPQFELPVGTDGERYDGPAQDPAGVVAEAEAETDAEAEAIEAAAPEDEGADPGRAPGLVAAPSERSD